MPGRHRQAKLEQRRGGVAKPGRQRVDGLPRPVTVVDAFHDDGQLQAGKRQADRQVIQRPRGCLGVRADQPLA